MLTATAAAVTARTQARASGDDNFVAISSDAMRHIFRSK